MAQRERAAVQKNTKLEARANAFISSASQLSGAISKLSGADSVSSSDSSGEALGWSPLKCSDTTSSKPSHYGSREDSNGNNYRSPESSVREGSDGERGGGGDWRRRQRRWRRWRQRRRRRRRRWRRKRMRQRRRKRSEAAAEGEAGAEAAQRRQRRRPPGHQWGGHGPGTRSTCGALCVANVVAVG